MLQVFLPDGACLLVAVDNPVGIEPYMQVSALIITWIMDERRGKPVIKNIR